MAIEVEKEPLRFGGLLSIRKHMLLSIPNKLQKVVKGKGLNTKTNNRKLLLDALEEARAAI